MKIAILSHNLTSNAAMRGHRLGLVARHLVRPPGSRKAILLFLDRDQGLYPLAQLCISHASHSQKSFANWTLNQLDRGAENRLLVVLSRWH
jgi:hypothetical protein